MFIISKLQFVHIIALMSVTYPSSDLQGTQINGELHHQPVLGSVEHEPSIYSVFYL
jgi:hypothetical protein